MSPDDSQGLKRGNPNYGSHVLNLSIRVRVYVGSRLHDRGRKVCSNTLFFRSDGVLPVDGFVGKTGKPILIKAATQLIRLSIFIEGRKERRR
jgi:hypothetical protein